MDCGAAAGGADGVRSAGGNGADCGAVAVVDGGGGTVVVVAADDDGGDGVAVAGAPQPR